MNEENTPEETPFNMAMMYYMSLNRLMDRKDICYIEGDIVGWYKCLHAIFRRIIFKIKKQSKKGDFPEYESLKSKFNKAFELVSSAPPTRRGSEQFLSLAQNSASNILSEIDEELMLILDKYKMIFPAIENKGGFGNIEKKLGLKYG